MASSGGLEVPLLGWLTVPLDLFLVRRPLENFLVKLLDSQSYLILSSSEVSTIVTPDFLSCTTNADETGQGLDKGVRL